MLAKCFSFWFLATGNRRHAAAACFTPELCFYLAHKSQRLDQLDLYAAKKKKSALIDLSVCGACD